MSIVPVKLASCLAVAMMLAPCFAKPMSEPSLEEGVKTAQWIVIAKFLDYRNPEKEPVSYMNSLLARYEIQRILKGAKMNQSPVTVVYDFHDGSACRALEGWRFTPAMMPVKDSKWILLLRKESRSEVWKQYRQIDAFTTYRGDFGRIPASDANLDKIKLLNKN